MSAFKSIINIIVLRNLFLNNKNLIKALNINFCNCFNDRSGVGNGG